MLLSVLERAHDAILAASPEWASRLGRETSSSRGTLNDRSKQGEQKLVGIWASAATELRGIRPSELSPTRRVQRASAIDALTHRVETRRRHEYGDENFYAYRLTQFTGAYATVPQLLSHLHPVQTRADADAYLSRLNQFSLALDQDTERQSEDARSGIVAPAFVLDLVLTNLRHLRKPENLHAALVRPLQSKSAESGLPDRSQEAIQIIEHTIMSALDRQIAATAGILESAGDTPGVWRLPDGESFYADALRHSTTGNITPAEAHEIGLQKVDEIQRQLDTLLRSQGYTRGTPAERITVIMNDPAQYFPDSDEGREALLDYLREDVEKVSAALPMAFSTLPSNNLEVIRMPRGLEGLGPAGAYLRGPDDGSGKPSVIIDLKDLEKWPRFSLKAFGRHEGVPGHHLQASLMQTSAAAPRLFDLLPNVAYNEGWALYAELLSQEMGLFEDDPMAEIGMWQSLLYRAARIVVDTGIHHKRWSRGQAVEYMVQTTAMPRAMMETEVNRYTIIPGQACAYMLGQIEWVLARDHMATVAGPSFDLRDFHDVLRDGPMPLNMLAKHAVQRRAMT